MTLMQLKKKLEMLRISSSLLRIHCFNHPLPIAWRGSSDIVPAVLENLNVFLSNVHHLSPPCTMVGMLYKGKVKEVWSTDDPDIVEFRYNRLD